jgi:hypothetical protein
MGGLFMCSERATSGAAQLVLAVLDPGIAMVGLAVAADMHVTHPALFLVACARAVCVRFAWERLGVWRRLRVLAARALLRPLLGSFATLGGLAEALRGRRDVARLYSGDEAAARACSTWALRAARHTLSLAAASIESVLADRRCRCSSDDSGGGGSGGGGDGYGSGMCAVCMSSVACVRLHPCLHCVLCRACFAAVCSASSLCPLCRVPFAFGDSSVSFSSSLSPSSSSSSSSSSSLLSPLSSSSSSSSSSSLTEQELRRAGLWRAHKRFLSSLTDTAF